MLVSSGLGSYFSRRVLAGSDSRLMRALGIVAVLVTVLAFLAPVVSDAGIPWPLPLKVLVTAALIVPPHSRWACRFRPDLPGWNDVIPHRFAGLGR